MPYTDDETGFTISGFVHTLNEPNITVESVVVTPGGATFRRDLGTFNRLTEDQEIRDAVSDTFEPLFPAVE